MILEELKKNNGETYLTISYDSTLDCVIDKWQGAFGSQENFKIGVRRIIKIIKEKNAKNWLADLTSLKGSFDSSSDWLASVVMPEAVDSGLRCEAIILPQNIFAKLSTKDAIKKVKNLSIQYFDSVEAGKNWIVENTGNTSPVES